MSAAAGCVVVASFEGITLNSAPLTGFAAVDGYDQTSAIPARMIPLAAGTFDRTWQAGIRTD